MSGTDDPEDEREELRQQKREQLRRELEDDPETPTGPVAVDGADHLEELVEDHQVVLVDFYADWCGPCKALDPVLESIAEQTQAVVAKVDVDSHQSLASEYGVRGVPTLVVYGDGKRVERLVGMQQREQLEALIERAS